MRGEFFRCLPGATFGDNPVGETESQRLVRLHGTPRQDHVQRPAVTDDAREAHRPAIDQRRAPAAAEDAEHGVFLDDAQVAPQRKFESARNRIACDCRYDGLGKDRSRRPHRRRRTIGANPVAPIASTREGFEVRACAECAMIAEKDANAGFVIRFESFERGDKLRRCFWIDGVPRVRTAQDHRRNRPALFRRDGHGCLLP